MKKGWKTKTLEEACQFSNGLWKGEKPPFVKVGVIRNTNFTKEGTLDDSDIAYLDVEAKKLEKRRLQFGDIILEKSGGGPKQPVGRVALFDKEDGDFSFSNFTAALRVLAPDDLDFRFVHKFLHWTYVSGVTEGMQSNSTGIRNLDGDAYKAIEISFPPLAEQQRIVGLLDEAFEGLATAKANAEKNLHNARALFESHLQSVFTQRGPGWKEKTLGDVCDATQGVQLPKSEQSPTKLPGYRRYLYISDFESDKNLKYVRDEHPKKLVTPDDIIVANTGSAGKIFRGIDGILSNNLFKVSFDSATVDRDFIFFFVTSGVFREYQQSIMRGTANPHMGHVNFKSTPICIPGIETQKVVVEKIHEFAEETQRLARLYERKHAALEALKKSLLHQAFNGEL